MNKRLSTSYAALLRQFCDDRLVSDAEAARIRRILKRGSAKVVAFTCHDVLRQLVTSGQLRIRNGATDRIGEVIRAADPKRGLLFSLPALITSDAPALMVPMDSSLAAAPVYQAAEVPTLFQEQSSRSLESVERSADVKGVVSGILDRIRGLLGVPAALCFSQTLPVPTGIGRGLQYLMWDKKRELDDPVAPQSAAERTRRLVATWEPWLAATLNSPDSLTYLPDLSLLPEADRPLPNGSALLLPLCNGESDWEAVVVALSNESFWFNQERLARLCMFGPHFRRQLSYSVNLQAAIAFDFLTGVYNRKYLEDQMARVLAGAERKDLSFSVLIIDIDDFKAFNSRFGYDAGDEVLCSVAKVLTKALRNTDILGRWGGEEFAAILAPPVSKMEASNIGERLRDAVAELKLTVPTLDGRRQKVQVTVSIGGALFPMNGKTRDDLWSEANMMLLAAKNEGKNCVRFPWSTGGDESFRVLPGPGSIQ
jgi:diguanylate cyclase (GGDEF)-like protein